MAVAGVSLGSGVVQVCLQTGDEMATLLRCPHTGISHFCADIRKKEQK